MASPQSISEQFNDSYNQKGLQPSTGTISPIRNVKTDYKNDPNARRGGKQTVRAAGTTLQASGLALQAGGKTAKVAGSAATVAGVALSGTVVGSVVGVPLAVLGRATSAAGAGVDKSGKAVSRAGKNIRSAGKNVNRASRINLNGIKLPVLGGVLSRASVTTLNMWIWSAGFLTWWFQLIFLERLRQLHEGRPPSCGGRRGDGLGRK